MTKTQAEKKIEAQNLTSEKKNFENLHSVREEILTNLKDLQPLLDGADPEEGQVWREKLELMEELVSNLSPSNGNGLEELVKQREQEKALAKIIDRIRQSQDLDAVFKVTTSEIRQLLKCDRLAIYRFNSDWSGEFVAESVGTEWVSLLEEQRNKPEIVENVNACSVRILAGNWGLVGESSRSRGDTYLQQTGGGSFSKGQIYRVSKDIYNSDFSDCYIQVLESYQAQAYIIAAIYQGQQLWGLLAAFQNTGPRDWVEEEIQLLVRIANQFSIAVQQANYLKQLQARNEQLLRREEQEKGLAKIVQRMRQFQDLEDVFEVATSETRHLLKCDRLAIFRFNSDWSGEFIAEAAGSEWVPLLEEQERNRAITKNVDNCVVKDLVSVNGVGGVTSRAYLADSYIQHTQGGPFSFGEVYRVTNDVYNSGFSDCYIKTLESYQARAYIIIAIYQGEQLWGLLAAFQNSGARNWLEDEIQLLAKLGTELSFVVQQAHYRQQIQTRNEKLVRIAERERTLARIIERIRQSLDLEELFKSTVQEIRRFLKADRVGVFQFYPDSGYDDGQIVSEDVVSGYSSALAAKIHDHCFGNQYADKYAAGGYQAVADIYNTGLSACHIDVLARFEVRANLVVPLVKGGELWGLLCVHQCSGPREWKEEEIQLIQQVASQFGVALQQAEYFKQLQAKNAEIIRAAEEEKAIARLVEQIAERINQSQDLAKIFQATLPEARQLLQCDRLAVYRFNSDWSGEFIAESVGSDWVSLVGPDRKTVWEDEYIMETKGGRYRNNETFAVNNIYTVGHSKCYVDILEQFQVRAYTIAPVFAGKKLWGLLGAYQNSGAREWKSEEVQLLAKLGDQFGIAVQQAEYVKQLQGKNAELARTAEIERELARVVEKIRQSQDLETMFRNILPDFRKLLACDRLAVFRFNPDWSGEFIVESIGHDWIPLVGANLKTVWEDDYMMETQGGRYRNNETFAVNDIYTAGHSPCYQDYLEKLQVRAYAIAPVFAGKKLWGLLGAYQNSQPREWKSEEVQLLAKLGVQLGIGVQQAEYIKQLYAKNIELHELAEREKREKERLQQGALRVLQALEPSFHGDLTVRAPLSEDEIGTIADGYNTTIQNLRDLVRQVQAVAMRVQHTSGNNNTSVAELSTQAKQQVEQLEQALEQLKLMVASTQAVSVDAQKVAEAVQEANRTVQTGDTLMESTVDGILEIRETVAETAKKIKRLGEASQKISKVVNLIENFATQTNLLAINAAIEATRAGSYGKGFAVVADEVRSLAYQSANATTEIGRLVEEIQAETNEVREAMELGISQVVRGTDLVNETRQTLSTIVTATSQISSLVQAITQAASSQSSQFMALTAAMTDVSAVAYKTSEKSTQISESFQELLATSQELQTSVSQFKVD